MAGLLYPESLKAVMRGNSLIDPFGYAEDLYRRFAKNPNALTALEATGLPATLAGNVAGNFALEKTGSPLAATIADVGMQTGLLPVAIAKGAPKVGKEIARQYETGEGLIGAMSIDPRQYAYLPGTKQKPNPLVGTRYVAEETNNLAPQVDLPIEKIKGASIVKTPYDNTSAGRMIYGVSDDITLDNPVYTMGGDDFSRLLSNYENQIGGASNYGIASRVANRFNEARKENLAQGGSGEVYSAPVTMSQELAPEAFSTYPTDILLQVINKSGNKKGIEEFNEWFRNSPVTVNQKAVRPFTNFKGIETPEGQMQFFTGGGFGPGGTPGNARKNLMQGGSLTKFEKMFDYNIGDVRGAVNDARFANLPKGYLKGNLIRTFENTKLSPSTAGSGIKSYDTDISGQYFGTIKPTPIEILMPKTYNRIYEEIATKYPQKGNKQIHNMVLGAMEKRAQGFSDVIDDEIIDNYYKFHEGLLGQ